MKRPLGWRLLKWPRILWGAVVLPILLVVAGTLAYDRIKERSTTNAMRGLALSSTRGNLITLVVEELSASGLQ